MSELDDLKKLDELKKQGIITDEEFASLRASTLKKAQSAEERIQNSTDSISENDWSMYIHLSQFLGLLVPFAGLIVPIVLWQMRKDRSVVVDEHGKNVTNWIISVLIYFAISGVLCFVLIGFVGIVIFSLALVVFPIIGAIKAKDGEAWKYPMTISFIK